MSNATQCQNLLLSSLSNHYKKKPEQRKMLHDIIVGTSPLSLRIIDWFVTHYARAQNIIYWIDDSTSTLYEHFPSSNGQHLRKFHLNLEYRAQLQSYTKMYFDPFRRYERITFVLESGPLVSIESTVGQLNFFRWALQNHVIEYIMNHIQDIEDNMASFQKSSKERSSSTTKTRQRIVSSKPVNTITHTQCFIRFD